MESWLLKIEFKIPKFIKTKTKTKTKTSFAFRALGRTFLLLTVAHLLQELQL
jgi:UTP:GlnB (protein PII) uridylyltransferase